MRPVLRLSVPLLALCAALLLGCRERQTGVELSLESLGPETLERGGRLVLSGAGFEPGRRYQALLEGQSHGPARHARLLELPLQGRALAEDRLEIQVPQQAFEALGPGGTFVGAVRVRAEPTPEAQPATGSLSGVRLDLRMPSHQGLAAQRRLHKQGTQLLDRLGALAAQEQPSRGLRVGSVEPGSVAARAGLRAGDLIEQQGDLSVHGRADLLPAPGDAELRLLLRRPRHKDPLLRVVSLAGITSARLSDAQFRLVLALVFSLVSIGLLAPYPSIAVRLARLRSRLGQAGPPRPRHPGHWVMTALGLCTVPSLWPWPSPEAGWLGGQGSWPFQWNLFVHPGLLLGLTLLLLWGASHWPTPPEPAPQQAGLAGRTRHLRALRPYLTGAMLGAFSAALLGGWQPLATQMLYPAAASALGLLAHVGKGLLLLWLVQTARRGAGPARPHHQLGTALLLLGLGLAPAIVFVEPATELLLGHVTFWSLLSLVGLAGLQARGAAAPMGQVIYSSMAVKKRCSRAD